MATTRRAPPAVDIYRDPVDELPSYDPSSVLDAEAQLIEAFRPNPDASSDENCVLNPPDSSRVGVSPRKSTRHSSSPPARVFGESDLNSVLLPPPRHQPLFTDSPRKQASHSRRHSRPSTAKSKSQHALFTTFSSAAAMEKENMYSSSVYGDSQPHHAQSTQALKPNGKRPMMEAAPAKDRNAKKQKTTTDEPLVLPEPEDMPAVDDDGNKPPFSYAVLIGMAILRAPGRRLTLAQIYKWISDTFQFYRNAESGWQNSIRHNLSLNKAFIKQERPKENPGKGNYWAIEPGCERQFLKDKAGRRHTVSESHAFIPEMARPATAPSMNTFAVKANQTKSVDSSKFPEETELSSDGTIPLSDPAMHDGQEHENPMPPPTTNMRSSPPPEIHSSPPPVAHAAREGTPPALPRLHSSRSGGRKRKFSTLGDSGYYSSIESSATRGQPRGPLLTSEADLDRPLIKRGRAEEEIARIRHSSYDSPTKSRPAIKQAQAQLPPSSPLRAHHSGTRGPLTPAVVFKRPAKPPASVSPNTHLKNHRNRMRQLIGSPQKATTLAEDAPWSPAFHLPDENHATPKGDFDMSFDIFEQSPLRLESDLRGSLYADSPCKKATPSKRPRLMHAFTTSNVLADITNSQKTQLRPSGGSQANTPNFMKPFLRYPGAEGTEGASPSKSPSKAPTSHPNASELPNLSFDLPQEELFGLEFPSDGSEEGLDIMQGFAKIGAAPTNQKAFDAAEPSPSKAGRPRLGRSSTSLF